MLNFDQIKELVELVSERGLEGLEVERRGFRLTIDGRSVRGADGGVPEASPETPTPGTETADADRTGERPPSAESVAAEPGDEPPEVAEDAHVVTSPIVGTFFAAPSPDAEPFVRVGDRVTSGQVLCIVEAMKIMNEIESDVDGEVVEVVPKNGQPVEYGEPLFAIQEA